MALAGFAFHRSLATPGIQSVERRQHQQRGPISAVSARLFHPPQMKFSLDLGSRWYHLSTTTLLLPVLCALARIYRQRQQTMEKRRREPRPGRFAGIMLNLHPWLDTYRFGGTSRATHAPPSDTRILFLCMLYIVSWVSLARALLVLYTHPHTLARSLALTGAFHGHESSHLYATNTGARRPSQALVLVRTHALIQ